MEPEDEVAEPDDAGEDHGVDPELLELHEVLELTGDRDDGGATGETVDPLAGEG